MRSAKKGGKMCVGPWQGYGFNQRSYTEGRETS